jgi:hypothetical protein
MMRSKSSDRTASRALVDRSVKRIDKITTENVSFGERQMKPFQPNT